MILEKIDQDLLALAKQSDNDLKDIYAQVDELSPTQTKSSKSTSK